MASRHRFIVGVDYGTTYSVWQSDQTKLEAWFTDRFLGRELRDN